MTNRPTRRARHVAIWLLACILGWFGVTSKHALAQEAALLPPEMASDGQRAGDEAKLTAELRSAIQAQRWVDAQLLLGLYPEALRREPKMLLIEALILRHTGQPRRAIDLYQRVIAKSKDPASVRVALAFAYLDINALDAAELQFHLALAGRLSPSVVALVNRTLLQIEEERRWVVNFSASIEPDSNVNAATDATRVNIYGIPFQLSDDARRHSGIDIVGSAGVDRVFHLSPGALFRISTYGRYSYSGDTAFNDAVAGLNLGPEFRVGLSRFAVRATEETRWFGGAHYSDALGGRFEWQRSFGLRTVYAVTLLGASYREARDSWRDGWQWGADVVRTRYLSPNEFWRITVNGRRSDARAASEAFSLGRLAVGYYRTLPLGFATFVEPSYTYSSYDSGSAAFLTRRQDKSAAMSIRLLKRDWSFAGFFPFSELDYTNTVSTIELYKFDRTRYEFGITRTF